MRNNSSRHRPYVRPVRINNPGGLLLGLTKSFFFPIADINECEKGNVCGKGGECVNMIGSYLCVCFSKGFTYDPKMGSCLGKKL